MSDGAAVVARLWGDEAWRARLELLDRLHNMVLLVKKDRIVFANQCALRWLRVVDAEGFVGTPFEAILHADYVAITEMGMDALVEDGMVPLKLIGSNGGELDVELWASRLGVPGPDVYLIEARDVSEHLRTAKALRSREQRLEGIIRTVADGILTVDDQGRVQTFNPAAERIFGFTAEEVIGQSIRTLIPDPVGTIQAADSLEFERVIASGEVIGKRKDGATFPLEVAVREMNQGGTVAFTSVVRDISARKRAEARLRDLAHHDHLTGLPNRFLFADRLELAISRALRHGTRLALAFIDLDHFKPINDRLGHAAGDHVLRCIAGRLSEAVRRTDTVARLAGDEFVAILEDAGSDEEIARIVDKVLTRICQPIPVAGTEVSVGGCIGIALFPDHGAGDEELLAAADKAMYRAKASGRNAWCFHNAEVCRADGG